MSTKRLIWAPRAVALVFTLFLVLFSFDVFGEEGSLAHKLLGLLVHNIPSIIMAVLLYISWNRPGIGACAYMLLALLFTLVFQTYEYWVKFVVVTCPLIVVSGLFALTLVRSRGATR